jgi:hypothetical protein
MAMEKGLDNKIKSAIFKSLKSAARFLIGLLLLFAAGLRAQSPEEIVVRFEAARLTQKDIVAFYKDNEIYLPLFEIFSTLEINIQGNFEKGVFGGQFLEANQKFEINLQKQKAKCGSVSVDLNPRQYLQGTTEIYLRPDLYQTLFGLKFYFNFSTLSVYLPLDKNFPAYQKLARKIAHQNLLEASAAEKDTADIPYRRDYFRGGTADWAITANSGGSRGHFGSLALGGMLAGGDLTVQVEGNTKQGIQADDVRYGWRYFVDKTGYITQVKLGQMQSAGQLGRRLTGGLITNAPLWQRKYFQTINISGRQAEGWEIELYINDRLVDYARADENGDYSFLTDIYYGSSRITLKMYGPNGESSIEERFLYVPYNLIPKNNLEYSVATGRGNDPQGSGFYLQSLTQYGILDNLTGSVNLEAPLKSNAGETPLAAVDATYRPIGNLILNALLSPDYMAKLAANFSRPSAIGINFSIARYFENRQRNKFRQLSSLVFSASSPLKIKNKRMGIRYHLSLDHFPDLTYINMNYGINSAIYKFHVNYIGSFRISRTESRSEREINSQLFLTTSFVKWIRPQFRASYNHTQNRLGTVGIYLSRRVLRRGQLSLSCERNIAAKSNFLMLNFNLFTDQAEFSSRLYNAAGQTTFTQTQRGSIRYDQNRDRFWFDRKNGVGFGAATIKPYLDANCNGIYDDGEQALQEMKARVEGFNGGVNGRNEYYDGLRAYDEYLIKIDPNSLDNPQLQPAHERFRVTVNPNSVTPIYIPIVEAGEISGAVDRKIQEGKAGVGGVKIIVVNQATGKQTKIITFNSGEFYYLGLTPGEYRAFIDLQQLENAGYTAEPTEILFTIKSVAGGDYLDNINFTLIPK